MAIGDTWKAEATPGKHSDGGGLYLDVRSATSASWLFKFTLGGKVDEIGLGSRNKVTLDQARALRTKYNEALGEGRNPKDVRENERLKLVREANAGDALSVHELAKKYVHLIAKRLKTDQGRKTFVRTLHEDFIGYVANLDPAKVTEDDVKPLLTRLYTGKDMDGNVVGKPRPVLAEDIRQRLHATLNFARADKRILTPGWENPVRWTGHLEVVLDTGEHEPKKHPALEHYKVGKFVAELRTRSERIVALATEWHVISATRGCETAGADWSEFDWTNQCWTVPAERMKMRREHRIPLTTRHDEILDELLGGAEPPASGPLFSVCLGKPISTAIMRWTVRQLVGKGPTLHGFRSSFGDWARSETYPVTLPTGELRRVRLYDEAMIEESLAHVVGGKVRNAYRRDDFLELRRPIMQAWATYCGKVQEGTVTVMRRRPVKVAA
jgi:integrase